ncbi:MAG: MFS transporter [Arenicellales bacterium]
MKRPLGLTHSVLLLSVCQALMYSGLALVVSTSALVGFALASDKVYSTLPFACQLLATMLTSIPAGALMARIGRKPAFQFAVLFGLAGGALCTTAILQGSFALFLAGSICIGMFTGFGNYYRFAAADSVDSDDRSRAIGYVLAGGVVAAFVGPNLASVTRDLIGHAAFAGSYASLIGLYILSFIMLAFLRLPAKPSEVGIGSGGSGRALRVIAGQSAFVVAVICGALGYALMSFIMTSTPLAMHDQGYAFSKSSFVIQWHVLGMFAPSFFTGYLIGRFGLLRIMTTGALAILACTVINLSGRSVPHFWTALVLLGVGWNFLFIGATTLLTRTYKPEEAFKTQAFNDFVVFSTVAAASLSSGAIQSRYGWQAVNLGAIPAVIVVLCALAWLAWRVKPGPLQEVDDSVAADR